MRLLFIFIFSLSYFTALTQPVSIPTVYHAVDKGDTWYSISKKYGVEITTIQRHNNLEENNFSLSEGTILEIPGVEQTPAKGLEEKEIHFIETNHKVKKGETLYSIAKQYQMNLRELQKLNDITYASPLIKPGMKLTVKTVAEQPGPIETNKGENKKEVVAKSPKQAALATTKENIKKGQEKSKPVKTKQPLVVELSKEELKLAGKTIHIVQKGETLYSISKKYNMSVRELKKANKVSGNNLPLNQQLIVNDLVSASEVIYGPNKKEVIETKVPIISTEVEAKEQDAETVFFEVADKSKSKQPSNVDTSLNNISAVPKNLNKSELENQKLSELPRRFENYSQTGVQITSEKGVAIWYDDKYGYGQDNYFALHHTASMGNVLKVTNVMNGRTVFVKVIGRLPKVDLDNNTIMKLSYTAAEDLNFIDDKVQVEVMLPVRN